MCNEFHSNYFSSRESDRENPQNHPNHPETTPAQAAADHELLLDDLEARDALLGRALGLSQENQRLRADNAKLRADNAKLRADNAKLRAAVTRLRLEASRLRTDMELARIGGATTERRTEGA